MEDGTGDQEGKGNFGWEEHRAAQSKFAIDDGGADNFITERPPVHNSFYEGMTKDLGAENAF